MKRRTFLVALTVTAASTRRGAANILAAPLPAIEKPPKGFDPFYAKYLPIHGFPIVGSAVVSDYALREAHYLIATTLGDRPDILKAMTEQNVRLAVMAYSERTTDIPEHRDLTPAAYWNRRARGLGATPSRPAVSCAEENLLCYTGDPYAAENIMLHEFAHAVHEMGMNRVDPTFDKRLREAYKSALDNGLWKGTYAATNPSEYFAEGVQSWFDTNRANDDQHNDVDTREKLKKYDPKLAKLIAEVYGDHTWRYARPKARRGEGLSHLEGFDVSKAPRFQWKPTDGAKPS